MPRVGREPQAIRARTERGVRPLQAPIPGEWWSVDPGQVHVGLARWRGTKLLDTTELSPDEFKELLIARQPKFIVIEAFTLRSPRWSNAQSVQAVDTIKLIGATEALMSTWRGAVEEQQPAVRHVAQRIPDWGELQAQDKVPANAHARSAVAHGLYYMRVTGP